MFTEAECQESSTYRELLAVQFVLSSFSSFLPNSRVKWFTDNQGAARIAQVGSMHFNLHKLPLIFFRYALNWELFWTFSGCPDLSMIRRITSAR